MGEIITHMSTRLWQEVLCGASKPIDGPLVSTGSPGAVTCEDCRRLLRQWADASSYFAPMGRYYRLMNNGDNDERQG